MNIQEILEQHKLWLEDSSQGKRVDLRRADLQGVDLRRADLQGADLQGADLRGADLRGADLRWTYLRGTYLQHTGVSTFQFQRHQGIYTPDGTVSIGCERHSIEYWVENIEKIGKLNEYSILEIKAYSNWLNFLKEIR